MGSDDKKSSDGSADKSGKQPSKDKSAKGTKSKEGDKKQTAAEIKAEEYQEFIQTCVGTSAVISSSPRL
jgi:hypothetical protein